MTNSGNLILFLLAFLTPCPDAICQGVMYPGDVNNNGIVNIMDAIYLNSVLFESGPQRDEVNNIAWAPFDYNPWNTTIPGTDNLNAAFADCDGDGVVTEWDLDAIYLNFHEEREAIIPDVFTEGEVNIDPKLQMTFNYEIIEDYENHFIKLEVEVQNNNPIEDLQACAIKLEYNEYSILPFPSEPEESGSWLAENPQELFGFDPFYFPGDDKEFAIIRKNHLGPMSGEGTFLTIDFIIIDDVIAYSEVDFETQIIIEDARFVTDEFTDIPVVYDTLDIVIPHEEIAEIVAVRNQVKEQENLIIAPNPSNGTLNILTNTLQITKIDLYNSIGRHVKSFTEIKNNTALNLSVHERGIYFLKCHSPKGIITRKIILQ